MLYAIIRWIIYIFKKVNIELEKDMEESEIYHPSFDIDFLYSYDFKTIKLGGYYEKV